MTWVKIDDRTAIHPKLLKAGPEAAWLWLCGLCHCNLHATDGRIDKSLLRSVMPYDGYGDTRLRTLAVRLVGVGLWHLEGEFYTVHDYKEYQELALSDMVSERKVAARERKRRSRQRSISKSVLNDSADLQKCHAVTCHTEIHPVTTPRPVPSRPVLKLSDQGHADPRARDGFDWLKVMTRFVASYERERGTVFGDIHRFHDQADSIARACTQQAELTSSTPDEVFSAVLSRAWADDFVRKARSPLLVIHRQIESYFKDKPRKGPAPNSEFVTDDIEAVWGKRKA